MHLRVTGAKSVFPALEVSWLRAVRARGRLAIGLLTYLVLVALCAKLAGLECCACLHFDVLSTFPSLYFLGFSESSLECLHM